MHDDGFSTLCLRLQLADTVVSGLNVEMIWDGQLCVFVSDQNGTIHGEQTIFTYGVKEWSITRISSRDADLPFGGDTTGEYEVDANEAPCKR